MPQVVALAAGGVRSTIVLKRFVAGQRAALAAHVYAGPGSVDQAGQSGSLGLGGLHQRLEQVGGASLLLALDQIGLQVAQDGIDVGQVGLQLVQTQSHESALGLAHQLMEVVRLLLDAGWCHPAILLISQGLEPLCPAAEPLSQLAGFLCVRPHLRLVAQVERALRPAPGKPIDPLNWSYSLRHVIEPFSASTILKKTQQALERRRRTCAHPTKDPYKPCHFLA